MRLFIAKLTYGFSCLIFAVLLIDCWLQACDPRLFDPCPSHSGYCEPYGADSDWDYINPFTYPTKSVL